jgi:hypothetical protein
MVNGVLSSIHLIISKSSFVKVPLTFIGIRASLPHSFTSFPLNQLIPPREGIIAGLPIASQVLFGIIFTCVSSSRTQSMWKSPILASMHSFSLKISDNLTCRWSSRVSFICINTSSDYCWGSAFSGSALGFS